MWVGIGLGNAANVSKLLGTYLAGAMESGSVQFKVEIYRVRIKGPVSGCTISESAYTDELSDYLEPTATSCPLILFSCTISRCGQYAGPFSLFLKVLSFSRRTCSLPGQHTDVVHFRQLYNCFGVVGFLSPVYRL